MIQIVSTQRAYFNTGATRPLSFRKEQLRKLYYLISDHNTELAAALSSDLGKPLQEAQGAEITMTMQDIINVVKNVLPSHELCLTLLQLDEWAKEEYVPVDMAFKFNKCRIRKEPIGVVLVMGPWNFPIWCNICPALNALAAGNTVVLKVRILWFNMINPLAL